VDDDSVAVACDEVTDDRIIDAVVAAFGRGSESAPLAKDGSGLPVGLPRRTPYLTHDTFHRYRAEASLARYLRRLADRDLALDRTMIPLGSCT